MRAFGAEIVLTPKAGGMEDARDMAEQMQSEGKGIILDQFANPDNPLAHYEGTGPEIWRDTEGSITHFVSAMGTTGTIMGCRAISRNRIAAIQIIGAQPADGSQIPGIRKWPEAYLPKICDTGARRPDRDVSQAEAEEMARRLAREEGIFCGISSAGACEVALRVSQTVENAIIVFIVCDRGDRYLSTGVFPGLTAAQTRACAAARAMTSPPAMAGTAAEHDGSGSRFIRPGWFAFFWFELLVADAELVAAVAHQVAQVADHRSLTSCMRISSEAPTGRRWWRILLITGGATSSARDRAASFFRRKFSIRVSSKRLGLYCSRSSESESLFISMPTWFVMMS